MAIMKLIGTLTWTVAVCNFHFTARHFAGIKNKTADSLSRLLQQFRHLDPEADKDPQICPGPQQLTWD